VTLEHVGPIGTRATYRLQLNAAFPFDAAAAIAPYLSQLGISHAYCSPYLQAARGSTHGYDVVDPTVVNQELGGAEAHERFCVTLGESGLGQLLDFVPNHMAVGDSANRWWRDVLQNGPASLYASYFDVDWSGGEESNRNRILLPILEDHYGRVVDGGRLRVELSEDEFVIRYHNDTFPLSPRTWDDILRRAAEQYPSDRIAFLADAFAHLPDASTSDQALIHLRLRDAAVLKGLLRAAIAEDPEVASAIDAAMAKISYDAEMLDALLRRQNYCLAYWRTAGEEIDYRRFFDVTGLASLRIEDEQVFNDVHALVSQWLKKGVIDGLRLDHIDGLRDPYGYLVRLRERTPRAWIVVEKILAVNERLPGNWPVQGTTGYEFMNAALGLLIDPEGEETLTRLYREVTGHTNAWPHLLLEKKRLVLHDLFSSDVRRLVVLFMAICKASRKYRDYTRREATELLAETIAQLSVYRTYARAEDQHLGEDDERRIASAIEAVKECRPGLDKELVDLLRDMLQLKRRGSDEAEFVMRFQQLTGPAMAKGAEDTGFYCYNRFVALNEVGGDPGRFGMSAADFHAICAENQANRPQTLLATTTHDTKRSEDVRARLAVLSEIPDAWAAAVKRWLERGSAYQQDGLPDANTLYLLFQNLVGVWPIEQERLTTYLRKASREAKEHTSWTAPSAAFEACLDEYVQKLYADQGMLDDIATFVDAIKYAGYVNALSQTLWKLTAPGVPDIYQGQELWDFSLVDPDNRRSVAFDRRTQLLDELQHLSTPEIQERWHEGLPKLWLTLQSLRLRKQQPECFGAEASYEPLPASGKYADHVVAFVRSGKVAAISHRWLRRRAGAWEGTTIALPAGEWQSCLSGEHFSGEVAMEQIFASFPAALLRLEKMN